MFFLQFSPGGFRKRGTFLGRGILLLAGRVSCFRKPPYLSSNPPPGCVAQHAKEGPGPRQAWRDFLHSGSEYRESLVTPLKASNQVETPKPQIQKASNQSEPLLQTAFTKFTRLRRYGSASGSSRPQAYDWQAIPIPKPSTVNTVASCVTQLCLPEMGRLYKDSRLELILFRPALVQYLFLWTSWQDYQASAVLARAAIWSWAVGF